MLRGMVGKKVYFIGEDRDQTFFDPMQLVEDAVEIQQVPLDQAEGIVCTGPFDPTADPDVMRSEFLYAKTKGLKLLCANPDIVVDRGEDREWCAGALAKLYTEMGGESLYFGKPHPPIYNLARARLTQMDMSVPDSRILAVGDGVFTDVQGALGENLDCLFITGGLAREETDTDTQPNQEKLTTYLENAQMEAPYSIGYLR
jgi:ribonucleotide monophosphatase NagD (HAD superfamily)